MQIDDPRLPRSFWSRVIPEPNSGCWLWLGSYTSNGYGRCEIDGHYLAHRYALSALHPIPPTLTVDHRCNTTCCVNPAHLQIVTSAANSQLRSARKPTCPNGHARNGNGDCRECARERSRRFKTQRRRMEAQEGGQVTDFAQRKLRAVNQ